MDKPIQIGWLNFTGKMIVWIGLVVAGGAMALNLTAPDRTASLIYGVGVGFALIVIGAILRAVSRHTFWWSIHVPDSLGSTPPGPEGAGKTSPLKPKPTPVLYEEQPLPKD